MTSLSEVSLAEFKEAMIPSNIRVSQIIYFAMTAGVSVFLLIIFIIYLRQDNIAPNYEMTSTLNIMSVTNIFITISMLFIGKIVSNRPYSKSNLENAVYRDYDDKNGNPLNLTPAQKSIAIIRSASILRLATLQSPAIFGLVTIYLVVVNGICNSSPIYFVNALSTLPFFIYIVFTFPTYERLEEIFKNKIQSAIY
jgi:hypothetical protein